MPLHPAHSPVDISAASVVALLLEPDAANEQIHQVVVRASETDSCECPWLRRWKPRRHGDLP